ncbi:MAG: hypothetical protein V3W34_16625 [Phycisphaerae bacterium]
MIRLMIACLCSCAATAHAGLHHQGVVAVQGERFTGQGLFRFALVNPDTDVYLWTSDGSAVVHPDPPTAAVTLTTINGVYNVLLGDPSLTNMTEIPDEVFAQNDDVVLRIWFDDNNGHGTHRLTPDLSIAPVPYAARASRCDGIGVPGSAELAVIAEPDGDVLVQSGDLIVENGNLTVGGTFTNFSVVGPFFVTAITTPRPRSVQLTEIATSFCALTGEEFDPSPSSGIARVSCRIQTSGEHWTLVAELTGNLVATGVVTCEARCFVFEGQ